MGSARSAARQALDLAEHEADFTTWVVKAAMTLGWCVCHIRPARTARGHRTPIQGHTGLPDIVLARAGVVVLAELKSETGRPTPEQRRWLAELGAHATVWRPRDRDVILAVLSGPRGVVPDLSGGGVLSGDAPG